MLRLGRIPAAGLFVQRGANDGSHKMREVRSAFIQLEPANDAMIGEIFCYARFRNAEMFGELRLERIGAATACSTPQEISNGDAQSLAGLDVVVAGQVGIGEDEDAGTDGRMIRFAKFHRRAGQQAAELHFEKRQSGGEARISGTATNARPAGFSDGFNGELRNGTALHRSRRSGFGWFVKYSRRQALRRSGGFRSARCGDACETFGRFSLSTIAAPSAATTAAFFLWRICGFRFGFHGGILGFRFGFGRNRRSFGHGGIPFRR